jgi:ankyrin repeat protein
MRIATGLTRKVGMLHKMVDAAANGDLKYSKVIAYIESQCLEEEVVSDDDGDEDDVTNQGDDMSSTWPTPKNSNRKLDGSRGSALSSVSPPTDKKPRTKTVPNEELRKELWYDSQGHSLLRKAVLKSAPHKLLLKLCNLCPEAAQVEDSKGRLVLHHACRLPVNEQTETILLLLLQTHVLGVIHRDAGGRTPLHYLFWYHASNRSVEVVTAFCGRIRKTKFYALRQQHDPTNKDGSNLPPLPEIPTPNASHSVPNTAAIIPDAQHGCLPLHYAVMEGATVDALQVLLQAYPLSKHAVDRYGQTPLHWYLGGHYLCQGTHVSGCDRDPNARPWHATPIDPNVVRLLSSSRVARTGDSQGRTPLHWAACYWAHAYHFQALSDEEEPAEFPLTVATAKVIVDQHIGALGQRDHQQQSPLMVLFQTTFSLQSGYKGPLLPLRFSPPLACVQILLEGTLLTDASSGADENRQAQPKNKVVELSRGKRRGCITTLEDASGDLPLHVALATAAPVEIVQAILAGHDGALLHGNDSNRVPLHCAFAFPHSAQLQHTEVISLLLSKTPGMLDGRLALKIEDSTGQYPIHLACQNNASIDILQVVVKAYPKTALLQNQNGCLPVHTVVSPHILVSALSLGKAASERAGFDGAESADDARVIEMRQERQRLFVAQARQKKLHEIQETREKILILIEPILLSDKAGTHLTLANEAGYLPLHFVVLFGAAYETLYRLLRACPVSALQLTNDGKSVLDLHEQKLFQKDWNEIRQLLFSFAPTLESHRHRVELLKQCVQIVVQEVSATSVHCEDNASSFHWTVEQKLKELENDLENAPELQLSQTLSTNIDAVKLSFSNSQHSEHHAMVKAASKASRLSTAKIAAAKNKQSDKSLKARRKSVQPSRGPKSFELSASLSDNAPTPSSPRAQAQSKYDEGDTRLNYVISDTEYDEDDSYFSDDDEEEEYLSDEEHTESEYDTTNRDSTMHSVPTNTFSSDFEASTSQGFHVMSSHSTLEEIFMTAKLKAMKNESEEKKDEYEARSREDHASLGIDTTTSSRSLMAPACDSDDSMLAFAVRPEWFSEVGLRIWAFFALYRDKHNPSDNYSSQVTSIFNEIEYDCVESLVMLPLPSCARMYFPETPSKDLKRLIFREAANPKCREFMHRMCFFIGTYEFQSDYGPDIVAYQSEDGNSVVVKAYEWLFTTEESTDAVTPGVSEATIWKTGEVPAEVGLAFRSVRRPVRIQFTKRQDVYDKEVRNRIRAGVPVECRGFEAVNNMVPLLNHYNANDSSRRENRMYLTDVQDGRFSTLQLCRGSTVGVYDSISLAEYPFALVYPDICSESLESLHSRCGVGESKQRKEICFAIADAVLHLHSRGKPHTVYILT